MNEPMPCVEALDVLLTDIDHASRRDAWRARRHIRQCARCRRVYEPDTDDKLNLVAAMRPRLPIALSGALIVLSAAQLALAVPWLTGHSLIPASHVMASHLTRDGAFGLTIASVGFTTAWRPRYAQATTLIAILIALAQLLTGGIDWHRHAVTVDFELVHVLVLLIVAANLAAAIAIGRRTPKAIPRPPTEPPRLAPH